MSLRALRPVVLALALIPIGACDKGGTASSGPASTADAMTPLPAPAGHLADIFVPAPADTWGKLRSSVGGAAVLLPQSFGGMASVLTGLPVTASAEIDEAVPVVGAAMRQGKGPLMVTLGLHVKSGERLIGQLTRGEAARFNANVDQASRVTLLTDKVSPESGRLALGVLGNYMLLAQTPADLFALGPYVVRTLPTKPVPKEEVAIEVGEAALSGPMLEAAREMRTHGEGAAAALIPVSSMLDGLIGLFGDATRARITLTLDPRVVHARATITPKPGGGPGSKMVAELPVGDAKPLLDLPDATTVGLLWRESPASRGESAPKQAEALSKILGQDVTAEDRAAISAALKAEAEARGDWQAIGIAWNGTGPTAMVRAPVTDTDKMKAALKQLVDLTALASFKKAIAGRGLSLTSEKSVVENVAGDVMRVRLGRADADDARGKGDKGKAEKGKADAKPRKGDDKSADKSRKADEPPPPDVPKAIDLLYLVNGEGLFATAGFDPKDALRSLTRAPANAPLSGVAPMAAALSEVRDASFVLVADALRISAMASGALPGAPAPALIAAGRTASPAELWARADVPFAVLQEIVTEYMKRRSVTPAPAPSPAPPGK